MVVNPNEDAVHDVFDRRRAEHVSREVEVEVVSRYAIPPATLEALAWFLGDVSPRTVDAIRNFAHVADLF